MSSEDSRSPCSESSRIQREMEVKHTYDVAYRVRGKKKKPEPFGPGYDREDERKDGMTVPPFRKLTGMSYEINKK